MGVTLPREEFHKIIEENISYSKNTWNLKRFENEFRSLLLTFIEKVIPKYESTIYFVRFSHI